MSWALPCSNLLQFRTNKIINQVHEMSGLQDQINLMTKSAGRKSLLLLGLALLLSLLLHDSAPQPAQTARLLTAYQTSSTRTNNVNKYCPTNVDRSSLAPASDVSAAQTNMNGVRSQLGVDGNSLMNKVMRVDLGGALSMIMSSIVGVSMFVGAFLVPFVVFLLAWPFLCCCCCCPASCPSKCCQQKEGLPYTRCELRWPAAINVLALLLVISISAYGFSSASKVSSSFQNMACSLAIFTDDILNGNVTADGSSFFTGLNVFSNSLTKLSGNLTTISTALNDLSLTASGNSYSAVSKITTVQTTYVKKIPDNAGSAQMALAYSTPINSATPSGTLTSSFAGILGQWSTADSLVYKLYTSIEYARLSMQAIKTSSNTFAGQVATIQSQIAPMQSTLGDLISSINSMDSGFSSLLSFISLFSNFGSVAMQSFYGFLIAFSSFSLLAVCMMCCCDKPGCRNLMYFSCTFLFLGALAAFAVAIAFSIAVPLLTWTCDYLTVALGSSAGFETNFGAFLSNSTVTQIEVCMPFGDGRIVSTVSGTAANGLNNLTSVITSFNTFNNATLQSYISSNLSALVTTANAYANTDISDLDTTNNNILAALSDPLNSTNNASCTGFTDYWVPSNNQNTSYSTAITCKSTAGTVGNLANCDASFGPSGVCKGCMDTTQLLTLEATSTAVSNAVKAKYGATCAFAATLSNTWTNYYSKKYTALGYPTVKTQVVGSVMYRIQQAVPQINDTTNTNSVFSAINAFRTVLNTANTSLSSIQNLTDPTYGLLAGLNCKLFGQDFVTLQNAMCGNFYNTVFTIRLTLGIAAWGILFAMCCTVCSGVRHFKQIGMAKGNQVSDSSFLRNDSPLSKQKNSFDEGSRRVLRNKSPRFNYQD